MFWLSVQSPELVFHLFPDDFQFNRIIENQIAKLGSDKKSGEHNQVITLKRLTVEVFYLVLDR